MINFKQLQLKTDQEALENHLKNHSGLEKDIEKMSLYHHLPDEIQTFLTANDCTEYSIQYTLNDAIKKHEHALNKINSCLWVIDRYFPHLRLHVNFDISLTYSITQSEPAA